MSGDSTAEMRPFGRNVVYNNILIVASLLSRPYLFGSGFTIPMMGSVHAHLT